MRSVMVWLPDDVKDELDAFCLAGDFKKKSIIRLALVEYMGRHQMDADEMAAMRSIKTIDE